MKGLPFIELYFIPSYFLVSCETFMGFISLVSLCWNEDQNLILTLGLYTNKWEVIMLVVLSWRCLVYDSIYI